VKWWQETMVYFRFWPQRKTAGVDMVVNYVTPFDRDVISAFAHQSRRFMGGGRLAVDRYYVPGFAVAAGNLDHFGTVCHLLSAFLGWRDCQWGLEHADLKRQPNGRIRISVKRFDTCSNGV
jgi:hypothetical protein